MEFTLYHDLKNEENIFYESENAFECTYFKHICWNCFREWHVYLTTRVYEPGFIVFMDKRGTILNDKDIFTQECAYSGHSKQHEIYENGKVIGYKDHDYNECPDYRNKKCVPMSVQELWDSVNKKEKFYAQYAYDNIQNRKRILDLGNTKTTLHLGLIKQNYDKEYNMHELWQDLYGGDVYIRNYKNNDNNNIEEIVHWKQILTGYEYNILIKEYKK